jgi:hypothetical protein
MKALAAARLFNSFFILSDLARLEPITLIPCSPLKGS